LGGGSPLVTCACPGKQIHIRAVAGSKKTLYASFLMMRKEPPRPATLTWGYGFRRSNCHSVSSAEYRDLLEGARRAASLIQKCRLCLKRRVKKESSAAGWA